MKIQYYLIHNNDLIRKERMINEFIKAGINLDDIKWIIKPERNEITMEFINKFVAGGITKTNNRYINAQNELSLGVMICSFKHYLALNDIILNNYEYAVIMEDNMRFEGNVPETINKYIEQLNENYKDWDIIFDNEWSHYNEGEVKEGLLVYPKSLEISDKNHGGTRGACFYLLNLGCAKKLYDNYIPFNNAPDWYMNDLFRKLNIKCFWSEPSVVKVWEHISTAI